MIWGLGTGRCGTRSLADQMGGVHEPKPWFEDEPVRYYYLNNDSMADLLMERLKDRMNLGFPVVVDLNNSYMIDLICRVDPSAEFIWLIREPVACISSFLNCGAWTKTDGYGKRKWRPLFGWSSAEDRTDKAIMYWKYVNLIIEEELQISGRPYHVIRTEDLTAHSNAHPIQDRISVDTLGIEECLFEYDRIIKKVT